MHLHYDWSNKEHIKKKMNYIRNIIILGKNPYNELPEIQKKDFDEYVDEYFETKKIIANHIPIEIGVNEPNIYERMQILEDPANAASESLDFYLHPMIKEFYERLNEYSNQIEQDFVKSLVKDKNHQSQGFAFTIIILIATGLLGILLGALLFFIK